jgi:hypothetical protein
MAHQPYSWLQLSAPTNLALNRPTYATSLWFFFAGSFCHFDPLFMLVNQVH